MSAARWNERYEPGYARSFALAVAVHALLVVVIVFGVQMQSHAPDAVTVELWEPPAPPKPKVEPHPVPPKVEPKPEPPKPEPKPEPPKPEPPKAKPAPPKPEPKIEKPDIVEKPAPKPRVKPEPKPEPPPPPPPKPKPKPKPKPEPKPKAPPRDEEFQRQLREQLAREQAAAQERQLRELVARQQVAARTRALATWMDKIRSKIRSNIPIQVAQEVVGNPEAIYDVTLLPTGEVLNATLRRSSGNKPYDDAVYRAILKSSPLPKPEQPGLFQREMELRFRPQDN